jgi:hypothetical protein
VYARLESKLQAWRDWRDALAGQMRDILEAAAFGGKKVSDAKVEDLIEKANALLDQVRACSANASACAE